MREEHQRETEGLLDSIRETSKELKLLQLTMDSYIPYEFQVPKIRVHLYWKLCTKLIE